MSQETIEQSPALAASQASWRCVQAKDKDGWLALMTDDVVIEDPIGPAYTNRAWENGVMAVLFVLAVYGAFSSGLVLYRAATGG